MVQCLRVSLAAARGPEGQDGRMVAFHDSIKKSTDGIFIDLPGGDILIKDKVESEPDFPDSISAMGLLSF